MTSENRPPSGSLLTSGFEVAGGIGLGLAIGLYIDRRWHSGPWGLIVGVTLGFAAGMYLLVKDAMKSNRN